MTFNELKRLLTIEYHSHNILTSGYVYVPNVLNIRDPTTPEAKKILTNFFVYTVGWDSPNGNKIRNEILNLIYN